MPVTKQFMRATYFAFALVALLAVGAASSVAPAQTSPFQSSSNPDRTITINGSINDFIADKVIAQLKTMDRESNEEIEIVVTSLGGSVYSGLRIIGTMESINSPVKTVCEGYCMSMAAVIVAAGEPGRRYATPYTTFLLHQVSSATQGTLESMKNDLREVERLQTLMTNMLVRYTGLSTYHLETIMSFDNFMSSEKALDLHLIDRISSKQDH